MQHWKQTMQRANGHFLRGELGEAREQYLQALAWAQTLFEQWGEADEAVAACVISYLNLADLHISLGRPEESAEYLCAIHQRLLLAAQDLCLAEELRQAALRHSARTYTELLAFIQAHGEYPRTTRLLAGHLDAPSFLPAAEQPTTHRYGVH